MKKPSGLNENPTCSTFIVQGKSSGRGTRDAERVPQHDVPAALPPSDRSDSVHFGNPGRGAPGG